MTERFQSFVVGITTCYKYIQRIKSMEMAEFDLKGTHVMCIFFLSHSAEGLTAAHLCRLCAEDKAAISRTISTLKSRGYLEDSDKKYRELLTLTEAGKDIAQKIDGLISQWVEFGGVGLTDDERDTFYRVLDHISNNLRENVEQKKLS